MIRSADIQDQETSNVITVTGNFTPGIVHSNIFADATAASLTVTLPDAISYKGKQFTVKKKDSSANTVTVATINSQTIDGVSTVVLTGQYGILRVRSDGANWYAITNSPASGTDAFNGGTITNTFTIAPTVVTSGVQTAETITGGVNTGLTASTEVPDIYYNLTRTVQWATGNIAIQRAIIIGQPTYTFVGASTISIAATFYIQGPPNPGTNATITNSYSLFINGGQSLFQGSLIVNSQYGLTMTQPAVTGQSNYLISLIGGLHLDLPASFENSDINFNLNRNVQFATGNITTQRTVLIQAPTYSFVGASTVSTAATLAISNAPQTGANATITNSHALWIQAGTARFDGGIIIGTTQLLATNISLTNNAAAQTATLSNAPVAGNPTKWIPINDNGTIRNIPAW